MVKMLPVATVENEVPEHTWEREALLCKPFCAFQNMNDVNSSLFQKLNKQPLLLEHVLVTKQRDRNHLMVQEIEMMFTE